MQRTRHPHPGRTFILALLAGALLPGCYNLRPSNGGGQTTPPAVRTVRAADIAVPAGYRVEVVATSLDFPTGVAFDREGRPRVLEAGYSYGEVFTVPRLLRLEADGRRTEVARGKRPPWNVWTTRTVPLTSARAARSAGAGS